MNEDIVKQITVGNLRLTIERDDNGTSPRDDDNFGTIAYKHRDYQLGEEKIDDPVDWLTRMLGLEEMEYEHTTGSLDELRSKFMDPEISGFIALPIYLFDHFGQTIATTPFGCRWDSGQVGYIYVSKDNVIKEYGDFSKDSQDKARSILEGEIKVFDQFITGDVYGFREEKIIKCDACGHVEYEETDSCWGFYGDDWSANGILYHISKCFHEELKKK